MGGKEGAKAAPGMNNGDVPDAGEAIVTNGAAAA